VAPPTEADAPSIHPAPSDDAIRGHRLPDDWQPTTELIAWTRTECPDVGPRDVDQFRDYWHSAASRTATKRDWNKAWRVWARREQGNRTRPAAVDRNPNSAPNRLQRGRDIAARLAAKEASTNTAAIQAGGQAIADLISFPGA
jgi:hypothetical protein